MKKDKLERFIRDNREAMDTREPRDVWPSIEKQLPSRSEPVQWFWKAAAIIFFVSTVGLTGYTYMNMDDKDNVAQNTHSTEFLGVEDFYFQQISEKRGLIAELQEDQTEGIEVVAELQKLDAMYLVLKEQYKENPSPEVVDALTLNLLVRIDLLNKTLDQLDRQEIPTEV